MRALLVGFLIATPSLLLASLASGPSELAALLAIIAATATFIEYRSAYPSFVEFRDAPPINRLRFISVLAMVFVLSVICKHLYQPTALTGMFSSLASVVGTALDFPYSPIRMVVLMLPSDVSPVLVQVVRSGAGISYLIAAVTIGAFFLLVRLSGWPVGNGAFNVWVNLPLFDPTAGRDVVQRLQRDGRVNIVIGALLPFIAPAAITITSNIYPPMNLGNPHVLIWLLTGWAFIPASMVIRGIALFRISELIEEKRRRAYANSDHMQTA